MSTKFLQALTFTLAAAMPMALPVQAWSAAAMPVHAAAPPALHASDVYVRVIQYTGDFDISGSIGSVTPKVFWQGLPLSGRTVALNVPYNVAGKWMDDCLHNRFTGHDCDMNTYQLGATLWTGGGAASIDATYQKNVQTAFDQLVSTLRAPLGPQSYTQNLQQQLKTGGNVFTFSAVPHAPNWSVTVQVYTKSAGAEVPLGTVYADDHHPFTTFSLQIAP